MGQGRSEKFLMLEMGSTDYSVERTKTENQNGYKIVQNRNMGQTTNKSSERRQRRQQHGKQENKKKSSSRSLELHNSVFWLKEELVRQSLQGTKAQRMGKSYEATEPIPTSSPTSSPTWMER